MFENQLFSTGFKEHNGKRLAFCLNKYKKLCIRVW